MEKNQGMNQHFTHWFVRENEAFVVLLGDDVLEESDEVRGCGGMGEEGE
jgi:UTP-glucose-1-phosphate uridylyltransferase